MTQPGVSWHCLQDVDLFKQYERLIHGMTHILPITEDTKHVLELYNGFSTSKVRHAPALYHGRAELLRAGESHLMCVTVTGHGRARKEVPSATHNPGAGSHC